MKKFILASVLMITVCIQIKAQSHLSNKLQTYHAPDGALLNSDFTVKVRQVGTAWKTIPTYLIKVDEVKDAKHNVENSSMSFFDFSGEVEVSVTFNHGTANQARVRPLSYKIAPQIEGNTLTFKLNQPRNISVEVNGDIFHNLLLFANPMLDNIPNKKDPNVIFFGAGIHEFKNKEFKIPSNKTVYIAGDAILRGRLLVNGVENVKIIGRGMVEHTIKGGIHISNSKNILIEGVFTTQCATGGSQNVTIRNVKSVSYYGWGDGMNVFASSNVTFDRVFCRNSDDCTTVYATRMGFKGNSRNVTMKNSTLWADVAHPIFIGIHGNAKLLDTIENISYKNIDILDHKEAQLDYQGCMSINAGDNNLIRNVRFEDIRVEDFRQGQLVNLRIFYNKKYCEAPGKSIENILFKDIDYNGNNAEVSMISGYNSERMVKNIVFQNLKINGKLITDDMPDKPKWYKTGDMARIYVGEHVEDVKFIK